LGRRCANDARTEKEIKAEGRHEKTRSEEEDEGQQRGGQRKREAQDIKTEEKERERKREGENVGTENCNVRTMKTGRTKGTTQRRYCSKHSATAAATTATID
jgi:hypothetical protein